MELNLKQETVLVQKDRLLYKLRKLFHKFEGCRYSFRNKLPEPNLYRPDLFVKRVHPYVFVGLELRATSYKPNVAEFLKELNPLLKKFEFNDTIDTSPNSYKAVAMNGDITSVVTIVHNKGAVMALYLEVFSEDIYD